MNGIQPPLTRPTEVEYPSSDGEPMAETGTHVLLMLSLIARLREHFRRRQDVYVIGNIFLYYEEGDSDKRRSPDVMVIKGIDASYERDSFKLWEEKAGPCVVIELTSKKTAEEDQGPKKTLYEQLGVREYFLFDPFADYLPAPLVGYRLIRTSENGSDEVTVRFEELPPAADGSLPSAELGLRLVPQGEELVLVEAATGRVLVPPPEAYAKLAELMQRLEASEQQREETEHRLEEAQHRLEEAEQQREEAERQREETAKKLEDERRERRRLEDELARLRSQQSPEETGP